LVVPVFQTKGGPESRHSSIFGSALAWCTGFNFANFHRSTQALGDFGICHASSRVRLRTAAMAMAGLSVFFVSPFHQTEGSARPAYNEGELQITPLDAHLRSALARCNGFNFATIFTGPTRAFGAFGNFVIRASALRVGPVIPGRGIMVLRPPTSDDSARRWDGSSAYPSSSKAATRPVLSCVPRRGHVHVTEFHRFYRCTLSTLD
jgi:hypothetical protein